MAALFCIVNAWLLCSRYQRLAGRQADMHAPAQLCFAACSKHPPVSVSAPWAFCPLWADLLWTYTAGMCVSLCRVCACMQTQHNVQINERNKNPGIVRPPMNPYMVRRPACCLLGKLPVKYSHALFACACCLASSLPSCQLRLLTLQARHHWQTQ